MIQLHFPTIFPPISRQIQPPTQPTLPPRPVPTAVMPPSVGAVALWCRPGTNKIPLRFQSARRRSRCSHRRMIQVMLDDVFVDYIYNFIYLSISISISIYLYLYNYIRVLMEFVECWCVVFVDTCGMIWWIEGVRDYPSEGMTSFYRMRGIFLTRLPSAYLT